MKAGFYNYYKSTDYLKDHNINTNDPCSICLCELDKNETRVNVIIDHKDSHIDISNNDDIRRKPSISQQTKHIIMKTLRRSKKLLKPIKCLMNVFCCCDAKRIFNKTRVIFSL